ncbi:MAG: DUF4143 domain-containing protein [Bifidobacteriaceae bacterium]|jgi:predicted AAA+ superfamily ATPase|nr:DUF4143 domain-containing protein [Bifidobacteriaceae bacterium]
MAAVVRIDLRTYSAPRWVAALVEESLAESPVTVVQGARQVGKSTLVAGLAKNRDARVYTLDDATTLERVRADATTFVRQSPGRTVVVDEVQRFPDLLVAIKAEVDRDRRPGRFLLTGSADLLHVTGSHESLAGRAETEVLGTLSQGELRGVRDGIVQHLAESPGWLLERGSEPLTREEYVATVAAGGYPEALRRDERGRERWFTGYASAIVDHDAAEISGIRDLDRLGRLLRLLAANSSGEVVTARLGRDAGIPERSVPAYLRLLQDLYLVHTLPAWRRNVAKRLIQRPKCYVSDAGLAAFLVDVGAGELADFDHGELFGSLLEGFVVGELVKQHAWSTVAHRLLHFRDPDGSDVDVVAELRGGGVIGVEVKASAEVSARSFKGLTYLRDRLGPAFRCGVVLYTGTDAFEFSDRLYAAPIATLWKE